ncbi:hypothetical protein BDK51DRAFT_26925 [Blyttiomyces helicus]|uniref:MRPL25 domain-containing protein n=1 Tax=Blyttiomyces helicus TaxID=388810 RepID=A0A4P9WBQ4_9FUNG|nr:hypothetical protein BDK51DRAFT_26925 [Blyttiomyces helicus]|eukprot:RKO90059.1 hypothetical protein BDK51DRAFT_26925 [Blyttiomyces helicus]
MSRRVSKSLAHLPSLLGVFARKNFPANRWPRFMPDDWILKQIAFPNPAAFRPRATDQAEIRHVCKMAGIDPVAYVGLPPEVEVVKALPNGPPKVATREIKRYERKKKIAENMAQMPERIAKWKEVSPGCHLSRIVGSLGVITANVFISTPSVTLQEKRKLKEAAKPEMPF